MSMLEKLEVSLSSDAPVYYEFLRRYNPKKNQIFAFYEGDEDSSYYRQFIQGCLPRTVEIEEIVAGCKNNVLKLNREFDWLHYCKKQIIFFVDRDLSEWLNEATEYDENVFVTDQYSVENYAVNLYTFKCMLTDIKGFGRAAKEEVEKMCEYFGDLLPIFENSMKPIMAMAVVGKRKNPKIALVDYTINTCLSFRLSGQEICFILDRDSDIQNKWKIDSTDDTAIQIQINDFEKRPHLYSVRGKWLLVFMVSLGEFMRCNFKIFAPSLSDGRSKLKPNCIIDKTRSFPVLAPRCLSLYPERLKKFIEDTVESFCKTKMLYADDKI